METRSEIKPVRVPIRIVERALETDSPATVSTLLDHLAGELRLASPAGAPTGMANGEAM